MISYPDILQGSEQWEELRRIRATASRFKEIVTAAKGDLATSAKAYAAELVAQQYFDRNPDPVKWTGNANTDNGNEREVEAREMFSHRTGYQVETIGFVTTDDRFLGCSPDGIIRGADGEFVAGLEMKCPTSKTHAGYVLDGGLPSEYKQQVHGSMYVTGLREWHFFSYFPTLEPLHVVVTWDAYTDKLAAAMDEFRVLYAMVRKDLMRKLKVA